MTGPSEPVIELRDIYRLFIDEYRFQTRFNWDRLQYFFVLNSAIIAVGISLLKDAGAAGAKPYLGFIFILGFAASEYAVRVARKGDEYYRRVIVKKTVVEKLLGRFDPIPLHANINLAIGTTAGMADVDGILRDPVAYMSKGFSPGTVKYWTTSLLRLFEVINVLGYFYTIIPGSLLMRCWTS